jgi:putative glutamine amidotransferase
MQPVIGVTQCSKLDDYVTSVEQAGGRARVLEVGESPRDLVTQLDGLVLTGGGDIDPVHYREERHPSVNDAEPGRDEFEIDLARRAVDLDLPTLAICRGAQVLNVSMGGTLVQDIPSEVTTGLSHSIKNPPDHVAHHVRVTAGTALERALGSAVDTSRTCRVNSRHHQSVGRLGRSLVPVATAPDGVIEAIERPDARFCVGVQWHPENFCRTGEFMPLFEALVTAARESAEGRRARDTELEP